MTLVLSLILLIVLFIFSGFFSGAETALFSLSKIERRRLQEKKTYISQKIAYFLEFPRRILLTILIGNLFVNTLAAALVTLIAMEYLNPEWVGVVMVIFTILLIIFGEITPKVLAVRNNEKGAWLCAIPLYVIFLLMTPIRWIFTQITDALMKLVAHEKKRTTSEAVSEEELKTLVQIGEEDGILDPQERHMIQKVFELGERPVKDIMIPRIDVAALDIDDSPEKHLSVIQRKHFTYLPVYQETIDHVLGVVSVQDYVLNSGRPLKELLEEPLFIPQTKRIDEALAEFKQKGISFAVCVDEHGGMDGIVTLEDILEEIFGEYHDEYAEVVNPIRRIANQEYLVEAKINLDDFNSYFASDLHAKEATTLGGFILELLGEVPHKGRGFETGNFEMRIQSVLRHRIHQVVVKPK